jgi:deoxycytidine triphosphate deaminase
MILSRPEIQAAIDRGEIKFSPNIDDRQLGDTSIDLRLGYKFTKLR